MKLYENFSSKYRSYRNLEEKLTRMRQNYACKDRKMKYDPTMFMKNPFIECKFDNKEEKTSNFFNPSNFIENKLGKDEKLSTNGTTPNSFEFPKVFPINFNNQFIFDFKSKKIEEVENSTCFNRDNKNRDINPKIITNSIKEITPIDNTCMQIPSLKISELKQKENFQEFNNHETQIKEIDNPFKIRTEIETENDDKKSKISYPTLRSVLNQEQNVSIRKTSKDSQSTFSRAEKLTSPQKTEVNEVNFDEFFCRKNVSNENVNSLNVNNPKNQIIDPFAGFY